MVTPLGFEPRTNGLKVRCSAVELRSQALEAQRRSYPVPAHLRHPTAAPILPAARRIRGEFVVILTVILSFIAAGFVSALAWRLHALNRSGALAATLIGGTITAAAGWSAGALLIAFFITSSILSRITGRLRPAQGANVERGSNRDAWQVLANGGVATICAVAWWLFDRDWLLGAFAASLAAAAADTWATEIGAFSRSKPRLITTLRPVERGVSGAVSPLGTLATVAGAATIGALAATLLRDHGASSAQLFIAVTVAGIGGSLFDSLLGASVQLQNRCHACDEITERRVHRCGTTTVYARGWRFLTNDTVNLLAIVAGAVIGGVLFR